MLISGRLTSIFHALAFVASAFLVGRGLGTRRCWHPDGRRHRCGGRAAGRRVRSDEERRAPTLFHGHHPGAGQIHQQQAARRQICRAGDRRRAPERSVGRCRGGRRQIGVGESVAHGCPRTAAAAGVARTAARRARRRSGGGRPGSRPAWPRRGQGHHRSEMRVLPRRAADRPLARQRRHAGSRSCAA